MHLCNDFHWRNSKCFGGTEMNAKHCRSHRGALGAFIFKSAASGGDAFGIWSEGEAKAHRKCQQTPKQSTNQDWTSRHGDRRRNARGSQQCEKYHVSVCYLPGSDCHQPTLLRLCTSACLWGCCARVSWNVLSLAKIGYHCLNYLFLTPCTPVISHPCIREMDGKVPQNSGSQGFPRHQNVKKKKLQT